MRWPVDAKSVLRCAFYRGYCRSHRQLVERERSGECLTLVSRGGVTVMRALLLLASPKASREPLDPTLIASRSASRIGDAECGVRFSHNNQGEGHANSSPLCPNGCL